MKNRLPALLALLLTVSGVAAVPAPAAAETVTATLDGGPLAVKEIPDWFCHDRDYPVITCYSTAADRDADLGLTASRTSGAMSTSSLSTAYVTIYRDINYGGTSFTISVAYDNLGSIGWNDAISSFKALNGGRPKWWLDANYTSTAWQWGAGVSVADIGSAANDAWSSVKNVP